MNRRTAWLVGAFTLIALLVASTVAQLGEVTTVVVGLDDVAVTAVVCVGILGMGFAAGRAA